MQHCLASPGDRLRSVNVCFTSIAIEDALTILSYASPYPVTVELEKPSIHVDGATYDRPKKGSVKYHPLMRSHSIDQLPSALALTKNATDDVDDKQKASRSKSTNAESQTTKVRLSEVATQKNRTPPVQRSDKVCIMCTQHMFCALCNPRLYVLTHAGD